MVLPLIDVSVVPVASKNTKNGEIPEARTALALRVSGPLVAEQDEPVGGGVGLTVTVTDWAALPPGPVQLSVYVAFAESAPLPCVPLTGSVPLHAPEAVHEVALVEDQVSVVLPPLATMLGLELIVTLAGMLEPVIPTEGPHADKTAPNAQTGSKCKLRVKARRRALQRNERNGGIIQFQMLPDVWSSATAAA